MISGKIQTCAAAVIFMLGGCGKKYRVHDSPDADFTKDQHGCKNEAIIALGPRPANPASGQTDPAEQIHYDHRLDRLISRCIKGRGWQLTTK